LYAAGRWDCLSSVIGIAGLEEGLVAYTLLAKAWNSLSSVCLL
jgi:hypothetical protein